MPLRQARFVMGTIVEIEIAGGAPDAADTALTAAFTEFERVETICNRFDPESALSAVNRDAAVHPIVVPKELFELLERGLRYTQLSGRAFSIVLLRMRRRRRRRCGFKGKIRETLA